MTNPATPSAGPDQKVESHPGWALFVGSVLALALLKEALRGLVQSPVAVHAKSLSRSDVGFGTAVLIRFVGRIGSGSVGVPR
jgi:hypothetical protein